MRIRKACIASLMAACAGAWAQTPVVKIGMVTTLSGSIAHLGEDSREGARLAFDELNAAGVTIGGRRVQLEMVSEDDAADPKQASQVAQKLADMKVHGVVGHSLSGTSLVASRIYHDAGIPQVMPAPSNPKLTRQGFKTVFRVNADDVHMGSTLGRYAVQTLKGRAIAVIDDRTTYGQGVAEEFIKAVTAAGGAIVIHSFTSDKATDFNAVLTGVKAKNPDVLFYGGVEAQAALMLRQMKQLAINAKFLGGDGLCAPTLVSMTSVEVGDDRIICAEGGGVEEGPQRATLEQFVAKFKARFKHDPYYAPYAYDAVRVMVDAMVRAGSWEPAKYLPALAATKDFPGVTGPLTFDAKGDLIDAALTLYTFRGGKRQLLAVVRR